MTILIEMKTTELIEGIFSIPFLIWKCNTGFAEGHTIIEEINVTSL